MEISQDLKKEVRQLLAELATLSEATSRSFVPSNQSKSAETRSGPTGGTPPCSCSPPCHSLLDHWARRFAEQRDPGHVRILLVLGRRDLWAAKHRSPPLENDEGHPEDTWETQVRCLEWFRGCTPEEAARIESLAGKGHVSPRWFEKLRRDNDCDVKTGRPQMPREHRCAMAHRLNAQGKSLRQIGREMNVSHETVRRYLRASLELLDEELAA